MLMATDRYARDVPVNTREAPQLRALSTCPILQPLAEVGEFAAGQSASFKVLFEPETEGRLLEAMPSAVHVFRVIQKIAYASLLSCVQQKVFQWALDNSSKSVMLPAGLTTASLLGLDSTSDAIPPIQPTGGMNFTGANLAGAAVIVNSPNAVTTATTTTGIDTALLQQLVSVLTTELELLRAAGHPKEALVSIERPLSELRDLSQMQNPKTSWLKESLASLRNVLEQGAGNVLGELTKPHVQAILALLSKQLGS